MLKLEEEITTLTDENKKLTSEKESLTKECERLTEKVKLAQAELVNYRRRKDEEVQNTLKYANQDIITELIPLVDNFERALGKDFQKRWAELNKKEINRLVNTLTNDVYQISGRAKFKDEFVTCGGVSLTSVNPSTLESKHIRHLYFAGEVLDIDGVTGGFNFQAAWTTGYTVAKSICQEALM